MRANHLASRTICVALYRHILTKIIIKICLWINKYRNLIIFEFRPQNRTWLYNTDLFSDCKSKFNRFSVSSPKPFFSWLNTAQLAASSNQYLVVQTCGDFIKIKSILDSVNGKRIRK